MKSTLILLVGGLLLNLTVKPTKPLISSFFAQDASILFGKEKDEKGWCATASADSETAQSVQLLMEHFRNASRDSQKSVEIIPIPVYVHVIKDTDGTGHITETQIMEQITKLNESFGGLTGGTNTAFGFTLAGFDYTANNDWFVALHDENGSPPEIAMKSALRNGGPNALNIYTKLYNYSGYATFPWRFTNSRRQYMDGIICRYTSFPGDTIVHEAGHWLGLFHTFEGSCSLPNDYVEDTPPENAHDPYLICVPGTDSCNNLPGLDPIYNFMNWVPDFCMNQFTEGQSSRMSAIYDIWRKVQPIFTIGTNPIIGSISLNNTTSFDINVFASAKQVINLSVSGLPSGIAASYPPTLVALPRHNRTVSLTLFQNSFVPPGVYPLTITASGTVTRSTQVLLKVQPSLSNPTVFYNANSSNIGLSQPIIDSQGNLIVVSSHSGSFCPSGCGIRLNSISPNGTSNWQAPDNGSFLAPASTRYWSPILGPIDSIYVPTLDSVLHAYNSNGTPVSGWPVTIAPTGTINWHFPGVSPVIVDQSDGTIFASTRQTFSFDSFPNRIIALRPNGTQKWVKDYPDHARASAAGNIIQGSQQDIYTFLFTSTTARFTRLDRVIGISLCDEPTTFGSDRAGGNGDGVFTDGISNLAVFGSDCFSQNIYAADVNRQIEFRKYDQGVIYAIDYPNNPYDPNSVRLLAVSKTGQFLWRNNDIIPSAIDQPIPVIKNGVLYVLGLDRTDNNKPKLFAVDAKYGLIISSLETSTLCSGCGVAVSDSGRVYISYADKIYRAN